MKADCGIVIVAAGSGLRMGGDIPKQLQRLGGLPLFLWSSRFFDSLQDVCSVVIVGPEAHLPFMEKEAKETGLKKLTAMVVGGENRQDSVLAGLSALPETCDFAGVHDGARPFPGPAVHEAIEIARQHGAAILASPVTDTVKRVAKGSNVISATEDRETLWAAQTPQFARRGVLMDALRHCVQKGILITDEASALAEFGVDVRVVHSPRTNLKVTTPEDWAVAETLAAAYIEETDNR
ncbi:2-C-methyl-D-erythritol 4-phosphate cytidylyltransferase [candidate division BRC1 bacterium HGW-BRC1-1]|jgi:2-C-methyl-D-erythritol 4-phosphate cytidylyltransferase|nr:MAG: 2-C-methyl-D-erythritol 4-phosphate cytidylyltransferase [candidate division BRC1 bacterium HGW-BRC1-1]